MSSESRRGASEAVIAGTLGRNMLTLTFCAVIGCFSLHTTPPDGWNLVFSETFDTPASLERFSFSDPSIWSWAADDGGVMMFSEGSSYTPPYTSPRAIALVNDLNLDQFVLEASVRQTGRNYAHRDLCFFFARTSPGRLGYVHLATKPDPSAHNIFRVFDSARAAQAPVSDEGIDWGDSFHTIVIQRLKRGGDVDVFFGGALQFTGPGDAWGRGQLGFGSFDDAGQIDSLKIWGPAKANDPARVLILGDSISIGYTPFVAGFLGENFLVTRPMANAKAAENCAGTTKGVGAINRWLEIEGGGFDIIHFNFGLHDVKAIDPETGKASGNAAHPKQAELEVYLSQLTKIVDRLQKTGARLIFATTTPVPEGNVRPFRSPADVQAYNAAAVKLMRARGIEVDDLYGFAFSNGQLGEIQRPIDVHFTREGSKALAKKVADSIISGP